MSIYKLRTQFGGFLKLLLGLIALVFIIGAIFSFGAAPGGRGRENGGASDVVATVNGSEISRQEFDTAWERTMYQANEQGIRSPLQYAEFRSRIFQELVQSRLLLQAAKEMGIDVSDRKVSAEVDKAVVSYLNENRNVVLGKPGKNEKRPEDPRDDRDYKQQLASIGSSVAQQEEFAKSRVPEDMIRAQIAQEGIQAKLKSTIKPVNDRDIEASYNVYKIRQIVLTAGSLPKEQVAARAKKIRDAAAGGEDFAKLARENSEGPSKDQGGLTDYSWENRWMLPPEVRDLVLKMKPGDVSKVVDTQFGSYIVKLEGVTPKMPAKLDKKARDARRKEIQQDREMMVQMDFQQKIASKQNVKVTDPELAGYWALYEAQKSFADKAAYEKQNKIAIASFKRAIKERSNNVVATVKLAQLLDQTGQTEEGIRLLYPILEGENATAEGADLRMLLGDMLFKKGENDKAIDQYELASEVAPKTDPSVHYQLVAKFQQLKRPDLVANEQKIIDDFTKRMEEMRALQEKANPKPAPKAPKSGG